MAGVGKTTPLTRIRGCWYCCSIKENGCVTSDGIEISAIERKNNGNNVALITVTRIVPREMVLS